MARPLGFVIITLSPACAGSESSVSEPYHLEVQITPVALPGDSFDGIELAVNGDPSVDAIDQTFPSFAEAQALSPFRITATRGTDTATLDFTAGDCFHESNGWALRDDLVVERYVIFLSENTPDRNLIFDGFAEYSCTDIHHQTIGAVGDCFCAD